MFLKFPLGRPHGNGRRLSSGVSLAGFLFLTGPLAAQEAAQSEAAGAGAEVPVEVSGLTVEPIAGDGAALDAAGAAEVAEFSEEKIKKLIPEALFLRFALGGIYDDNIYQADIYKVSDIVMQGQVGVMVRTPESPKSSLSFNYDATSFWYLDHPELDAVNQGAGLNGGLNIGKSKLGASFNYQRVEGGEQVLLRQSSQNPDDTTSGVTSDRSSAVDREVGQTTQRDLLAGSLSWNRELASKTNLMTRLSFSGTYYDDERYQSNEETAGRVGLSYDVTGKTALGLAAVYGHLENGINPAQDFQKLLVTADYDATGKLVVTGEAGLEFRQYGTASYQVVQNTTLPATDGTQSAIVPVVTNVETEEVDTTRFVFNLQAAYQVRVRTALRFSASRSTDGSAVAGGPSQDRTNLTASLDQGLGRRFAAGLAGGFESLDYQNTEVSQTYWFGRATLNFSPTPRSSIGLFFEHRDNDTDGGGLNYAANRIGFQCAVSF